MTEQDRNEKVQKLEDDKALATKTMKNYELKITNEKIDENELEEVNDFECELEDEKIS